MCRDKLFVFPFRLLTSAWFTRQQSEDKILNNTGMATILLSKQLNFFWRLKKSTCSRTCHISCYQDFLSWSMNFSCFWCWLSVRSFGHEEKNLRVMKWSLNRSLKNYTGSNTFHLYKNAHLKIKWINYWIIEWLRLEVSSGYKYLVQPPDKQDHLEDVT